MRGGLRLKRASKDAEGCGTGYANISRPLFSKTEIEGGGRDELISTKTQDSTALVSGGFNCFGKGLGLLWSFHKAEASGGAPTAWTSHAAICGSAAPGAVIPATAASHAVDTG